MKLLKKCQKIVAASTCLFIFSCASTNVENKDSETPSNNKTENTSINNNSKNEVKQDSNHKNFLESTEGLTIEVISTPKDAINGKVFATPFIAKVKKAENSKSIKDLSFFVSYPKERNDSGIVYETESVKLIASSDSEGILEYTPPVTTFAVKDELTFGLYSEKYKEEAKKYQAKFEYNVMTNQKSAGGVISVLEFKKDGKPMMSDSTFSSKLLISLINSGFSKIGNDDFTSSILQENESKIFSETGKYNGTFGYLIFGTVKHYEDEESLGFVNLVAEIKCMNLKDGSILYKTEEKTSEKDLITARTALAKKISQSIIYGM